MSIFMASTNTYVYHVALLTPSYLWTEALSCMWRPLLVPASPHCPQFLTFHWFCSCNPSSLTMFLMDPKALDRFLGHCFPQVLSTSWFPSPCAFQVVPCVSPLTPLLLPGPPRSLPPAQLPCNSSCSLSPWHSTSLHILLSIFSLQCLSRLLNQHVASMWRYVIVLCVSHLVPCHWKLQASATCWVTMWLSSGGMWLCKGAPACVLAHMSPLCLVRSPTEWIHHVAFKWRYVTVPWPPACQMGHMHEGE